MSKWEAARPSTILILFFVLPAIATVFLPKAIYAAVNGNFADSWAGFALFGIFFSMEIAGLISILSPSRHIKFHQGKTEVEKQV